MSKATIHYYDIGDYKNRQEKLEIIQGFKSIENVPWTTLQPNEHGDWIEQRNEKFNDYIPIEAEKKYNLESHSFFITHSLGIATNKDIFLYDFSKENLNNKVNTMIEFYNKERHRIHKINAQNNINNVVTYDSTKIVWTDMFLKDLKNNIKYMKNDLCFTTSIYRPFIKQQFFYEKQLIQRTYQQTKLFPSQEYKNLVICLSCIASKNDLSVIITNTVPDLHLVGDTQCFPLYYYEEKKHSTQIDMFSDEKSQDFIQKDGISDFILKRAKERYGSKVTKQDIFYYVYGILHSKTYREKFSANLKKMLPRLPLVSNAQNFWAFSRAGKELAELHINYETVEPYSNVIVEGKEKENFTVEKMSFAKKGEKDTIIFNKDITIRNIPAKAYEYIVNGKSAIEWITERYAITTHKESKITNNPNDWATEHNKPQYIFDLLLGIINVSVQTVDIVNALPVVDWDEE